MNLIMSQYWTGMNFFMYIISRRNLSKFDLTAIPKSSLTPVILFALDHVLFIPQVVNNAQLCQGLIAWLKLLSELIY